MSTFDKVKDVIIDKLGVEEDSIKSEAHFVGSAVEYIEKHQ